MSGPWATNVPSAESQPIAAAYLSLRSELTRPMWTRLPRRFASAVSALAWGPSFQPVDPPRNSTSTEGHGTSSRSSPSCATRATGRPNQARIGGTNGSDRLSVASASQSTSGATANRHRERDCADRRDSISRYCLSPQ
jgi:hypothetical protein